MKRDRIKQIKEVLIDYALNNDKHNPTEIREFLKSQDIDELFEVVCQTLDSNFQLSYDELKQAVKEV